ncbi:hypothetical protein CupriaWKF_09905 [Cupriavidus sp. WKF15]|uniref:hypothetical protein n=1 Tax=Cupriavidus sp. WKF15 TaxID=3032282 RepID=UPI0023E2AFC0|nr:hypothetical protein [Cupriavidus sp. WKF15]WER44660.1 hypothetical protein CupriaWKF_09905 [Cupriavidus sp. WKF15]
MSDIAGLLVLAVVVFGLNLMPAFAPPTWMVMSWIGFSLPEANPALLALAAACAATAGRLVLAQMAFTLVRQRWMREDDRRNIDVVGQWLGRRKSMTVGFMLAYAFSPFPSNYLFIAYGLTGMRLWMIGLPFFAGRFISYFLWTHLAQVGSRYLDTDLDGAYFGLYFVLSQLLLLAVVYLFTRVDWVCLLHERRLRWRRSRRLSSPP